MKTKSDTDLRPEYDFSGGVRGKYVARLTRPLDQASGQAGQAPVQVQRMKWWQLVEAKARMSELVRRAQRAPQGITLRGKPAAVLVSQAVFENLSRASGTLVEFMQASPLAGSATPAFPRSGSRRRAVPKR